jgi:citrate lyase beta subunit
MSGDARATDAVPDRAAPYRALRTVFECPILDDHKWAKLPSIDADMFFLDLEDSVALTRKEEARERAVGFLADDSYFGGRLTLARPNHLSTPWGYDDIVALAESGVTCMAYPKMDSAEELLEVIELLEKHGASPDIFAIIETSGSVMDLAAIARVDNVVALMSGPGDLSVDIGLPLYEADGQLNQFFRTTKNLTVLAGAANRLATTDIAYCLDVRDLDEVRRRIETSRVMGFTTMSCFYPPHVPIINEVFTPREEEVARANELVEVYEAVIGEGKPAALTDDGEVILVHDYEKAKSLLLKAAR